MAGKPTYRVIKVLDASRILIGNRRGFGKDKEFYEQLNNDLKEDWAQRHSVPVEERKTEFSVGEHVLVKSNIKDDGRPRRAVVLDVNGATTSVQEKLYSVYLYDDGCLEDLPERRVGSLSKLRVQQLEPRTVIVRLTGMVPAKLVIDLARQALKEDNTSILTQDSSWSSRANRMATEWLSNSDVKYLGLVISKTNQDGSVYGDIYRKFRSRAIPQQPEEEETSEGATPTGGKPKKEKQYLTEYLLTENLALRNDEMAASQLKVRVQGQASTENVQKSGPSSSRNMSPSSVLGNVEETVLNRTKVEFPDKDEAKSSCTESVADNGFSSQSDGSRELTSTKLVFDTSVDSTTKYGINVPGRLLVRGRHVRRPYTKIEEYRLNKNILKAMDALKTTELSDMHKVVAPNFIRGSDIILIAPDDNSQLGKNVRVLSYILPILRLVYEKYEDLTSVDEKEAPETIIIVNSYNTGINLESYINQLLNYSQNLPMRVKFLTKDTTTAQHQHNPNRRMVPGGLGIFITTMNYLAAVMQTQDGPFLFGKLRFLMFEELDLYLKNYKEEILTFISAARENLEISCTNLPFQITFSGSRWSAEMESLYKEIVKDRAPMVVIDSPNQVLRYAKLKWKVHYVSEESERMERLMEVLTTCISSAHRRIVIACSTPEVAETVCKSIQTKDVVQVQGIYSSLDTNSINDVLSRWSRRRINVLVISDDMMSNVKEIEDATCLINYDSPELQMQGGVRRPIAAERFGYLWANIRHIEVESPLSNRMPQTKGSPSLIAHFLMTGEEHNFQLMCRFASSLDESAEIAPELKEFYEMMEVSSQDAPMCRGTQLFGFCNNLDPDNCRARHFFTKEELSATPSAPLTGEVEVRIIKCENPSSYQAELMRHYVFENGKRVCNRSYLNEARRRRTELTKFYGSGVVDSERIKQLTSFNPGTWCAVHVMEEEQEYFARAKLDRVLQKNKFGEPITLRVHCVDSGMVLNPSVNRVYHLPQEFQDWAALVVNLILCNLKPTRAEVEYRQEIERKTKILTLDKIFNAKIWLSIGNTIWVNPLVEYHVDPTTKSPYRGDSVRVTLIHDKLAEFNPHHLETLMQCVRKYPDVYKGITSTCQWADNSDEVIMAKQEFHQPGDEIQWAFVGKSRGNKFDPAKIVAQYGYHPWLFFGIHDKYYNELKNLENELHKTIEEYIHGAQEDKDRFNYQDMFKNLYEVGMVVAAKERGDQTWMRGYITAKFEDDDKREDGPGTRTYEVFFVDYGDTCTDMTVEELFPIPHKFVSKMPFQVIAFRLDHIQPVGGGEHWSKRQKNLLLDTIMLDGLSVDVEVVAYEDAEDTSLNPLPCRYYNAVVFYKGNDLGAFLVEQSAAEWTPGKENMVNDTKEKLLNFYNVSVDQALAADDEEEDEGANAEDGFFEEFDINFEGADLQALLGIPVNGTKFPNFSIISGNGEVETSVQPTISNAIAPAANPPTTSAPKLPVPASTASPSRDGLLHPTLIWRQTDQSFILTIQLSDIKEFQLKVLDDKNTIEFETLDKSPNYGFKFRVYGKLELQYSTHITGQYMRITFVKKMKNSTWPRVLFSKSEKYTWLKDDLDYICDPEDEVEVSAGWEDFAKLAKDKEENSKSDSDDDSMGFTHEDGDLDEEDEDSPDDDD